LDGADVLPVPRVPELGRATSLDERRQDVVAEVTEAVLALPVLAGRPLELAEQRVGGEGEDFRRDDVGGRVVRLELVAFDTPLGGDDDAVAGDVAVVPGRHHRDVRVRGGVVGGDAGGVHPVNGVGGGEGEDSRGDDVGGRVVRLERVAFDAPLGGDDDAVAGDVAVVPGRHHRDVRVRGEVVGDDVGVVHPVDGVGGGDEDDLRLVVA